MTAQPTVYFSGYRVMPMSATQPDLVLDNAVIRVTNGQVDWIRMRDQVGTIPEDAQVFYGHGHLLTPGLIDCHTHLVYGGNRALEWEMRLRGIRYEDIARAGGGILSTVRNTRSATEIELESRANRRIQNWLAEGVTTIEIKSGYGLDLDSELKMLRVAKQLEHSSDIRVVGTLLAAHAIPPEFRGHSDNYIKLICTEMIPMARESGLCSAVDAFCETIAFSLPQVKQVFAASVENGLQFKVHAEQLSRTGAGVLAAQMGALSIDHLEYLSSEDCLAIRDLPTIATLLPGAFYYLREKQLPPIDELRSNGISIAIGTDHNPGSSPIHSLLTAGNLACQLFGLTPTECLAGITLNAAKALGLADQIGSLEVGKDADFAVWEAASAAELFYEIGHRPCVASFRKGRLRVHA